MAGCPEGTDPAIGLKQPSFRYSPLDSSKNEIRLLHLLEANPIESAAGAGTPECKMFTVHLDHEDDFAYVAVYVQGSPERTKTIIVNGHPVLIAQISIASWCICNAIWAFRCGSTLCALIKKTRLKGQCKFRG